MITADLITGFLGSGKTTFIKKYVRYLLHKGEKVCILENDFGAVNVDTMLLQELTDIGCGLEMVSGACDRDCHQRRFKTKLIAIAMSGYSRVVIEPSGIFDVDEFFDTLRESPLDKWYKTGSVIAVADPTPGNELSEESEYLLASQAAAAGKIVFSHCSEVGSDDIKAAVERIRSAMARIHADRDPFSYYIAKPWDYLTEDDYDEISSCGCKETDFVKLCAEPVGYSSVYFMNLSPSPDDLRQIARKIMSDDRCGNVFRVKGFTFSDNHWYELNAAAGKFNIRKIRTGQPIIIVIGEHLNRDHIGSYFSL